ncbi:helix-turn-helix domain-containing protein [Eisenbergiella porci]|uniref:helix-turn-helix domain-containing protein n=1 Tax=Eisenbergiella porci TaxID=2652274 RepID=UPI002A820932|nr:helix-turn-helix domain-containing protein [Eisenbergiella porci]
MFTICLVDDERGIAEGIRFLLEASGQEVEVIGIAGDGREGMKMILEKKPDIVIADVRMPVMDGLAMIEGLNNAGCTSKFVMLSGYSEFEYARQAIRLGVKFYICKPVEEEELYEVIRKICREVEEERRKSRELIHLEHTVEDFRKDRKELQLRRLLDEDLRSEETAEVLAENGFPTEGMQYLCAVWESNSEVPLSQEEFAALSEGLKDFLGFYACVEVIRYSGIQAVLLVADRKLAEEELSVQMTEARQQLSLEPDRPVSIGIGSIHCHPEEIGSSFQEAVKALQNKVIRGIGSVICFRELEQQEGSQFLIGEEEIRRLEGYMGSGDMAGCRQVIHQIFRRIQEQRGLTISALQLQSLNIILSGLRTMPFMQFQLDEYLGKNILSLESISRFQTIEQMENWVINTVSGILELKRKENGNKNKDVIVRIKEYIQEHFSSEISLNEIAGKFYLNPYYLSQLFKKKTGMTYQNYVTMLRMEKAKQLLRQDRKVYEVCEQVGYSDTAYFSRVFEKTVGCKPSEYRRNDS